MVAVFIFANIFVILSINMIVIPIANIPRILSSTCLPIYLSIFLSICHLILIAESVLAT